MEGERGQRSVDTVRCLQCGIEYDKPFGGGTEEQNPGCPACGYAGWITATDRPVDRGWPGTGWLRSDADPRLHLLGRWN